MKTKSIAREIAKGRQDVILQEVLQATTANGEVHKLKIRIRSDAYAEQCYAHLHRWDGEKWQLLHALEGMATRPGLESLRREVAFDEFKADHKELLRIAKGVLS